MAAAAAATAPAAASEQEVQLHAVAGSDALLAEFQQRFQPVSGARRGGTSCTSFGQLRSAPRTLARARGT